MEIIIRRALPDDCPRLLELVKELADYEKAPQEVTISTEAFFEGGFGRNPVWWAFVAEEDGLVIGFALYYIRFSTWKGKQMFLEDLLVTQSARGKGIGSMLMERLKIEAAEKGFLAIIWQVLDWNQPAIDFYKKMGAKITNEWLNSTLVLDHSLSNLKKY